MRAQDEIRQLFGSGLRSPSIWCFQKTSIILFWHPKDLEVVPHPKTINHINNDMNINIHIDINMNMCRSDFCPHTRSTGAWDSQKNSQIPNRTMNAWIVNFLSETASAWELRNATDAKITFVCQINEIRPKWAICDRNFNWKWGLPKTRFGGMSGELFTAHPSHVQTR